MQLNTEQESALNSIVSGDNIFLTGAAGTGKSCLVDKIKELYDGMVITASTGVAAVNIDGVTIHSFLGIIPTPNGLKKIYNKTINDRIKCVNSILIDEISMISASLLEMIDDTLKKAKGNNEPFGGVQMIFTGDFLQLPPVSSRDNKEHFAFESPIWEELSLTKIRLTQNMRQGSTELSALLDRVRNRTANYSDQLWLKNQCKPDRDISDYTILFPTNGEADRYNKKMQEALASKEVTFDAVNEIGSDEEIKEIKKSYMIEEKVILKIGSKVMLKINDYIDEYNIANGSVGTVVDFKNGMPVVEFENGSELTIERKAFQKVSVANDEDIDGNTVSEVVVEASVLQIPLKLCWAITIHKSQGLTFEKVHCDFSRLFAPGQGYVALSRATSITTLSITGLTPKAFSIDQKAFNFMNND